jgi:hypothetical protein
MDINSNNPKHTFKIKCPTDDEYTLVGRPCELSSFCFVPANRIQESAARSIYNFKATTNTCQKDLNDCSIYEFNNKIHRCDRKHAKSIGLDIFGEEIKKSTPSRYSSQYGRNILSIQSIDPLKVNYLNNLDPPNRKYCHVATVSSEFYNRNGVFN